MLDLDTLQNQLIDGWNAGTRFVPTTPRNTPRGSLGNRLGRRPGESLEFVDYRDYEPGDDLRRLDWNAYARSDTLVVRVYREEITPHLDVVLDASASMAVREPKAAAATMLLGLLAGAAATGGFSHRAVQVRNRSEVIENSSSPPSTWQLLPLDGQNDCGETLMADTPRFAPHGVRVFVSDLLFGSDPEMVTTVLAADASAAAVIHLLDEPDRSPPQRGTMKLIDSETGQLQELFIDETIRQRYQRRLETHTREWEHACHRRGIRFAELTAESALDGNFDTLIESGVLELSQ
ncbi:MAG: DUF58 domain-containing protein [Planctomycetia bacterium]|jgi:uncharacterized protein (DUF58 family)